MIGKILAWLYSSDNMLRAILIAVYGALVFTGATTSSIGISTLREDSDTPLGNQWGKASSIRADEYNAFSPIVLSIMATGHVPTTSILAAPAGLVHRYSSGGFFDSVVFFDSTMLRAAKFLPDAMLFAAHWWLPALVLFLFLPKWFEQVGATRRWGWFAAVLIALAPSSSWWTMMPIQMLAYTVAGSSLMLSAYALFSLRRPVIGVLTCVPAGILIAGLPSFYIPWALVLGLPILVSSVVWVLSRKEAWAPRLLAIGCTGVVAAIFGLGMLWDNRSGMAALLDTVYPGSRRSTGGAQSFGVLFGAPAMGFLRDMVPIGSNQSEISMAYTVAFVWAAVLFIGIKSFRPLADYSQVFVLGAFGLAWLAWSTINIGDFGTSIPLMNYVQPARAAQVCGNLGIILACLLLAKLPKRVGWRIPLFSGLTGGMVTAYAASTLQQTFLPAITSTGILVTAAMVALSLFFITINPHKVWPMLLVSVVAVIPVVGTNPLIFGLGDLRISASASYMRAEGLESRNSGTIWASNLPAFDTLMVANGVPSLSGLQRSGPDLDQWSRLDPEQSEKNEWNRGGGFVYFEWIPRHPVWFDNNGSDSPIVRVDPCELKNLVPNMAGIASTIPLEMSCLKLENTLQWSDQKVMIYKY